MSRRVVRNNGNPTSVLDLAVRERDSVPKSERSVLDEIIEHPHRFAEQSMAQTARQAGVSEPTVRRACQSLGFSGFKELQRELTRELAIGMPAAFSEIEAEDDLSNIVVKVLDRSLSGLSKVRAELDAGALEQAVDRLLAARAVVCIGMGASKVVATDAAQKLAILGVPVTSPADLHDMYTTIYLTPIDTVVVVFSNSGETKDTVRLLQLALERDLHVVAITGEAESTVARLAEISIAAETPENSDLFAPSVSRLAALSVVDVLSGALTVRLGPEYWERFKHMKVGLLDYKTSE